MCRIQCGMNLLIAWCRLQQFQFTKCVFSVSRWEILERCFPLLCCTLWMIMKRRCLHMLKSHTQQRIPLRHCYLWWESHRNSQWPQGFNQRLQYHKMRIVSFSCWNESYYPACPPCRELCILSEGLHGNLSVCIGGDWSSVAKKSSWYRGTNGIKSISLSCW